MLQSRVRARRMRWKNIMGAKKNKDNSLIVGRDLREQRKCLDEVYEVDESKYNERYAEGSGG